jgi:shikimate 5-dehydrogenase
MLAGQGAIAFEMWSGVPAPVDVMRWVLEALIGV